MAITPTYVSGLPTSLEVQYVDHPSLTWYKNPITGQLTGPVDGIEAVRQAVDEYLSVARFKYTLYTPNHGMDWEGLLGSDSGYVVSELKRRLADVFLPDNRITDVTDFEFSQDADNLFCNFTVVTVFGSFTRAGAVAGVSDG